jgi:hypothetical protein
MVPADDIGECKEELCRELEFDGEIGRRGVELDVAGSPNDDSMG